MLSPNIAEYIKSHVTLLVKEFEVASFVLHCQNGI